MMRKVIGYSDLSALKSSNMYESLRECPQIAESTALARKMRKLKVFTNVKTFGEIIRRVDEEWADKTSRMEEMILISQMIRGRIEASCDESERLWLRGCSHRIFDMHSAICLLEEASVSPDDIISQNRDQALMLDAWNLLLNNNSSIQRFRDRMSDPHCMNSIIDALGCDEKCPHEITVVIHAFYFITPIQERIIRIMEDNGVNIVFLIPYNSKHAYANQIWTETYNEENGYQGLDSWTMLERHTRNSFGSILEGEVDYWNTFEIKAYDGIVDMIRDLSSEGLETITLYSPNDSTANDILRDFFPGMYGVRTLTSYPLGGFIRALHRMWDTETQSIRISPVLMEECFAYGWVLDNKRRRSNSLMGDLHRVLPFFRGCESVTQWDERLTLLHSIQRDVISIFESKNKDPSEKRWEDVMGNPFSNFSMFEVRDQDLDSIIEIIRRLIAIAESLFSKTSDVELSSHMDGLISVIDEGRDFSGIRDDEYRIVSDLLTWIKTSSPGVYEMSDIVNAMAAFLDTKVRCSEVEETPSVEWVRPMYEMDGNTSERVAILLCDSDNLPGPKRPSIWPITDNLMANIVKKQAQHDEYPLLGNTVFISECAPLANRHLVYSAFRNGNVTLSYVKEIDGKRKVPSPYIRLLEGICNGDRDGSILEPTRVPISEIQPEISRIITASMAGKDYAPEAMIEYAICPRRFLYSYILSRRPTYADQFHQEFLLSGLVEAVTHLRPSNDYDKAEAIANVRVLFPHIRRISMQNIIDNSYRQRLSGGDRRRGNRYTSMRYWVEYPRPLMKRIDDSEYKPELNVIKDMTRGVPERLSCMYCPHVKYCRNAIFQVDEK